MPFQVVCRVHRKGGVVDRRAIRDDHEDAPRLLPDSQPSMRPFQRFAVDVFLEQAFLHHQAKILSSMPPRCVGGLVDDVAYVIQPPGQLRAPLLQPGFA